MFQVKASRSFCPSISMSSRMGTSTSGWDAFSWITAGSWSSKLEGKWPHAQQCGLGPCAQGLPLCTTGHRDLLREDPSATG